MTQLFVNNGAATLAASLSVQVAGYTEDVTLDSPVNTLPWATYTAPDDRYMLATLTDGAYYEIVWLYYSATTTTATVRTVIRGQEGTSPRAWPAGTSLIAPLTAGTLAKILVRGDHTPGTNAVSLVPSGSGTGATGADSTAVGPSALASGATALALAGSAAGDRAVAAGPSSNAVADDSVALGSGAEARTGADRSTALGAGASAFTPDSVAVYGLPVATPSDWLYGAGYEFFQGTGEWVGLSEALDFKTTQTVTPAVPAGVRFFVTEVGVIVESATAVTVQPTVSFGIVGTSGKHVAAVATTGLTAAWKRQRFTSLLSDDGETALEAKVTAGATATTLQARFYWKGFAVCEPTS